MNCGYFNSRPHAKAALQMRQHPKDFKRLNRSNRSNLPPARGAKSVHELALTDGWTGAERSSSSFMGYYSTSSPKPQGGYSKLITLFRSLPQNPPDSFRPLLLPPFPPLYGKGNILSSRRLKSMPIRDCLCCHTSSAIVSAPPGTLL